jgi:putative flippase GtrA/2-polyprenyl-3-methyl-5-hydroxy-6-metoxy-1,4-benzoquinol methylase
MGSKGRAFVAELFRFHLVGAGTLAIGTLVFLALVALGFSYVLALAGDYAVGILFSYYMNKTFTFRAKVGSDLKPLSWTALGYLVTYLLNLLLLAGAVELFSLHVVYSQFVIMLVLALLNYLVFKFFIFGVLTRGAADSATQASTEMLAMEYQRMAAVERDMWWYTSLHADLLDIIGKHFGQAQGIRILDAGCGTGGFLDYARRHGYNNCKGLDISPLAVESCRQQGLEVVQGSIADTAALAAAGNADVIVAIDVICSLPDEQQRVDFLHAASRLLNDGGLLIVQTPAFRCLGGIHDLAVGVNQRYTKGDMQQLLKRADIHSYRLRYRLLLLTPLVFVARSLQRLQLRFRHNVPIMSDVKMPPGVVNSFLFYLQRMEDRWLPIRPFGTSLQILVRKAQHA